METKFNKKGIIKRTLSIVLTLALCVGILPTGAVFADNDTIKVDNDYIEVTSKADGSAYGINTIKGVPGKRFDDNKPLLYDEDDKFATSYTTVRIVKNPNGTNETVNDYIFGSSAGQTVLPPTERQLDNENRAIETIWAVDGVEITQQLIINGNTASANGGYADIRYEYKNTNADSVGVGIRILLDTKIADNDGGQFYKNGGSTPITKETEFEGDAIPEWYSISDSVTYSTTTSYGLLKNSSMQRYPDKVQMAHWFNLANTLWDYNVDSSVNFDDYYNDYKCPDSAISIMFNPELVNSGQSNSVDTMYGVGELNGMESTSNYCVMTVTQKEELKANADNTGYENNGEITLYVTIDNSDPESKQIVDGKLKLVFEDKLLDNELNMTQEPAVWVPTEKEEDETISVGDINRGTIKRNIPVKLKARPVYKKNKNNSDDNAPDIVYQPTEGYTLYTGIDTRKISLQLTGVGTPIPSVASKVVTLPALGSEKIDLAFTGIDPKTIYYQGYSYFSAQGMGENFNTLTDKTNWTAYLRNVVTNEIINIDSFNCSVDTENKQLGLLVDMGGRLGEFELTIEYKNNLAYLGKRVFSDSADHIKTTDDEKYKNRGYSIASIARTGENASYEMRLFSADAGSSKSIEEQFSEYKENIEENDGEMLLEGRGVFKVLYKTGITAESSNNDNMVISTNAADNNPDIMGFETISGSDNIKLNRIMYYNSMTPLSFKAEFDSSGKPNIMKVEGDGDLSIINASTIWKHKFMIRLVMSDIYTYDTGDDGLSNSTAPQLQLLGGGWLLQNMGGFIFNLNYGELGCQDGRYTINFSGSVEFPLGMSKDKTEQPTEGNTSSGEAPQQTQSIASNPSSGRTWQSATPSGAGTGSGSGTGTSGSTQTTTETTAQAEKKLFKDGNEATENLGKFGDGGSLGVSVDSILFGEHESRNDENVIETGFVGIAANVSIELPKSVFPAGGSQNNDSRLSDGARASNPTDANSQMVSARNPNATTVIGQQRNAANARTKGKGKLNGFEMGVSFNSYEFNAGVDLGIGIGPISSAFRMSLAETNTGKICLDTIYLEIKGFEVPIVPGVSSLTGLGGGISDLASSINYKGDARPPVTVSVMAVFDLVKVMVMQADMSVSGNGLTFSITGAPKGFDQIKFVAKGEFDWTTGFSMKLSGTVDMFSGIVLGNVTLALTTKPEFFMMGKISGSLNIPGLGKLAGVTLAITNNYIAGGVKILIFSGGFVYYYDSNKFRLISGSEVDEIDEIDLDNTEMSSDSASGNSISTQSFLEVIEVPDENGNIQLMGIGGGASVVGTTVDNAVNSKYSAPLKLLNTNSFETDVTDAMISGNDLVLRVYYDVETAPSLKVTDPNGDDYSIIAYDYNKTQEKNNAAGANMVLSEKEDDGVTKKYAYVTIDNAKLKSGKWKVESTNSVEISDYTVFTIPSANPKTEIAAAEISGTNLNAAWTADSNADVCVVLVPCDDSANPLTETLTDDDGKEVKDENGNAVVNEKPGYIVYKGKGSGNTSIDLGTVPSGKYIVRLDSLMNQMVYTNAYSANPLEYTNPNTLQAPTVTASAGGDGRLDVSANVPDNATGIQFNVYKIVENDDGSETEELLPAIGGYVGDDENKGTVSTYFKGENTILDEDGAAKYTSEIRPGEKYRVKAYALNMKENSGFFKSETAQSEIITVPIPNPPKANVNVVSYNAQNRTDEKDVKYLQASNSNLLIDYTITNFGTAPNDEVTVRFDIDGKQYGEEIKNDSSSGGKGYAAFNLTDGEHFVDIVFINKDGDVTVETRKFSIDTIPADIKIEYPQNGSVFDPSVGIPIKLTTDDSVTLDIELDGKTVVSGEQIGYTKAQNANGNNEYNTAFETTIPTVLSNYSHEVKIVATDKNGNKTEHIATVVNSRASKISGIKILGNMISDNTTELTAIGLDADGKSLGIDISKDKFKWTLLSDPSQASLLVSSGNDSTVVSQQSEAPFSVMAQLDLGSGQYLADVYDSGIVGNKDQPQDDDKKDDDKKHSSGGGGGGAVYGNSAPDEVKELIEKVKASMSESASVDAYKMYAESDFVAKQNDNAAFVSGKDISNENYFVFGTDSNTSAYTDGLPEGGTIRSDVICAETLSPQDKLLLDFKVRGIGVDKNIGVYKYSESTHKWIYIGGDLDSARMMMSVYAIGGGKYALIENPRMSEIDFADIDSTWARLYIQSLGYAGLTDGYIEDGVRYFKPENEITRGEFVKMLASAKGTAIDGADVSMFADSEEIESWAAPYAAAAYRDGWLKGSQTDRGVEAQLSQRITRQDAMTLVYRVFFDSEPTSGTIGFSDSSNVSEYAQTAVAYLTENGIVSGFEDGSLRPLESLLREQIAKILWVSVLK